MYSSLGICRVFPPKLTQLSELTVLSCCSHRMSSRFAPHPLNKPCPLFSCRAHKLLIVGRHIYLCPITIGFLHVGYPMIGKVLWKDAPDVSQMPAHCVPLPLGSRQVSYLFPDASLPCQTLSRYVFKRDA